MPFALTFLGYGYLFSGDLQAAKEVLESACKTRTDSLVALLLYLPYFVSSLVSSELGRYDEALRLAEKSLAVAKETDDGIGQALSMAQMGIALGQDDPSQFVRAEELIDNAIERLDRLKIHAISIILKACFLGRLYVDTGQKKRAMLRSQEIQKSIQDMERLEIDFWLKKAREYWAKIQE